MDLATTGEGRAPSTCTGARRRVYICAATEERIWVGGIRVGGIRMGWDGMGWDGIG